MVAFIYAAVVQLIERFLAKEEVAGLSPVCRSSSNTHPGVFIFGCLTLFLSEDNMVTNGDVP